MKPYYVLFLAISILFSCKKKEDATPTSDPSSPTPIVYKCASCASKPDAKAAYDNKNAGVYKGVLIGSSGTFKIMMQEGDTTATLHFDGTTLALIKTKFDTTGGNIDAIFASGSTVLSIYVTANGTNASVTATIPGHPSIITQVNKEKSDRIVKSYEGTYSGTNNAAGVYNMVVVGANAYVIWKGASTNGRIDGTISGNEMTGGGGSQVAAKGTFSDTDNVSGTWTQGTDSGTWSGKRTL